MNGIHTLSPVVLPPLAAGVLEGEGMAEAWGFFNPVLRICLYREARADFQCISQFVLGQEQKARQWHPGFGRFFQTLSGLCSGCSVLTAKLGLTPT